MAKILKGSAVAESINKTLNEHSKALRLAGVSPTVAILRVGDNPDQVSYEKSAAKRCSDAGVSVENVILPKDADEKTVIDAVHNMNNDKNIHGVLILRPLPKHIDDNYVRCALAPGKDIDGITDISLAGVLSGVNAGFNPCTAKACIEILDFYNIDVTGKRAVVLGRSLVVGKPVALMLTDKNATVTICHTKTADLAAVTRAADIVIAAVGKPECLGAEYFSPGQVVIDVGINWSKAKQKLCGDVNFDEVEPIVAAISPVPGGVGAVTSVILASHVVTAAERSRT